MAPKRVDAAAVLVEPGRQADPVRKAQARRASPDRRPGAGRRRRPAACAGSPASAPSVRSCACSGSSPNRNGRASGIGNERHRRGDSGIAVAYSVRPSPGPLPHAGEGNHDRTAHRERHLRRHRRPRRPPVGRADRSARCTTSTSPTEKMPPELIRALALVKRSAARRQPRRSACSTRAKADAIVAAADEVLAGRHDGEFPLVGLADRLRHADQHEHERGARQPRLAAARRRRAAKARLVHPNDDVNRSQSSNDVFPTAMSVAAVEALDAAAAAGARGAARHARGEGAGVRRHRQDRPHPPAGRDAADARPGDLRLGGAARPRPGARARGAAAPVRAGARRHGGRHRPERARRASAEQVAAELARAHRAAVRLRAEQVRGAGRARRARPRARRAEDAGGVADEDRQRRALAGLRAALRPRRDPHSRRTSPAARSCRARSTRPSARR